jgi:hypothetical protein
VTFRSDEDDEMDAEIQIFVEKVCGARFQSEKASLVMDARALLIEPGVMDRWTYQLFTLATAAEITGWLAESLPNPAEALVKHLLYRGFYASSTTDLTDYAGTALDALAASATPHHATLYHTTAHDGPYM